MKDQLISLKIEKIDKITYKNLIGETKSISAYYRLALNKNFEIEQKIYINADFDKFEHLTIDDVTLYIEKLNHQLRLKYKDILDSHKILRPEDAFKFQKLNQDFNYNINSIKELNTIQNQYSNFDRGIINK